MLNGWVGPSFVDPQTPPYRFAVYSILLLTTCLSVCVCVCMGVCVRLGVCDNPVGDSGGEIGEIKGNRHWNVTINKVKYFIKYTAKTEILTHYVYNN